MREPSLSVNVIFHQIDVYLQRGCYKSDTYIKFSGLYVNLTCYGASF